VHVAVARVHVQCDEHPGAQGLALDLDAARHHRRIRVAAEDLLERRLELRLPRAGYRAILQRRKRGVDAMAKVLPPRANARDELAGVVDLRGELLGRRARVVARSPRGQELRSAHERCERVGKLELVRERKLDVELLDAVAVVTEPLERDDDVLVDLERVRVPGDRRGARAIQPELLARFRGNRDEPFRTARVGDTDHFRRGLGDGASSSPTMSPRSTIFGRP
jgi:hypothetical protein